MTNEVTIPLLPCASIDDIVTFYEVLGFRTTYRQRKPNPYVAMQRDDREVRGHHGAQASGRRRRVFLAKRAPHSVNALGKQFLGLEWRFAG